jgi:hypothetical protein
VRLSVSDRPGQADRRDPWARSPGERFVHVAPCQGCVHVLLILGDRAVKAARAGSVGSVVTKLLDEAPHYPEGTGIRLEVEGPKLVPVIRRLARIKLEN